MRLRLAALGIGIAVVLAVLLGVEFSPTAGLIHAAIGQQKWVLGFLIATLVLGIAGGQFWRFRHFHRVWSVFVAYLLLHLLVAIPVIGSFGEIRYGHIEELYLWALGIAEWAAVYLVLRLITASLPLSGERVVES